MFISLPYLNHSFDNLHLSRPLPSHQIKSPTENTQRIRKRMFILYSLSYSAPLSKSIIYLWPFCVDKKRGEQWKNRELFLRPFVHMVYLEEQFPWSESVTHTNSTSILSSFLLPFWTFALYHCVFGGAECLPEEDARLIYCSVSDFCWSGDKFSNVSSLFIKWL